MASAAVAPRNNDHGSAFEAESDQEIGGAHENNICHDSLIVDVLMKTSAGRSPKTNDGDLVPPGF